MVSGLHLDRSIRLGSARRAAVGGTGMANWRWWLVLLAAVMFSMSGQ
jgi:hypothetical protein